MKWILRILSIGIVILSGLSQAHATESASLNPWSSSGYSPGYVTDVEAEKSERYREVYFFVPDASKEKSLQEIIFSPLTAEFKQKYYERFGQLDTGSIAYQQTNFDLFDLNSGANQSVVYEDDQRQKFAQYMTKRIIEFHFDNYMKTQPSMRPVMELKEKVENVKVQVTQQMRLNIQYNFAGNMADVILENPWCRSKASLEMNPSGFGPSSIQETRLWLAKDIPNHLTLNSNATITDGSIYGDITKHFRNNITTLIGAKASYKGSGATYRDGATPRETRYLVGFGYSY